MKTSTIVTAAAGMVVGAAAGVVLCSTEWGQKNVLLPTLAIKERLKSKFDSDEDEDDDEEDELLDADKEQSNDEHVEKD